MSVSAVQLAATAPVTVIKDASDTTDYRKALSCFGTGVTVVTTQWDGQDCGMTCNSFASVSLEPKLVLWSLRKEASSYPAFTQAGGFCVNVLSQEQQAQAWQFAKGSMAERFAGVSSKREASGRLRLAQAVAWFDCDLHEMVQAGDHVILIGAVRTYGHTDANAVGFWRSQFVPFEHA